MQATLRRKNIDLPVDALQKLSLMAVASGKSLKAYIENVLIAKAANISVIVNDSPSPSGDEWFDDAQNLASVERGIAQAKSGQGRAYSMDDIKAALGV